MDLGSAISRKNVRSYSFHWPVPVRRPPGSKTGEGISLPMRGVVKNS